MNINLTLIGQSIAFLFFVWFCKAYVWAAIRKAMDEREQRISSGLETADRAERDLVLAQKKVTEQMSDAKKEAAAIIDAAHKRAAQIIDEAKITAGEEGDRIKLAAQADIEREMNQAKEQLRGQVAQLVVDASEKVLAASIDEKAHGALIDKMAANF